MLLVNLILKKIQKIASTIIEIMKMKIKTSLSNLKWKWKWKGKKVSSKKFSAIRKKCLCRARNITLKVEKCIPTLISFKV